MIKSINDIENSALAIVQTKKKLDLWSNCHILNEKYNYEW